MKLDKTLPTGVAIDLQPGVPLFLAVGLIAGAVIALQICIMRIFSVGSWAHVGSMVVSLAMLGFGLTSAIMCVAKPWFERHWRGVAAGALILFGPLMVASNLCAQLIPFNAIFIVSDPAQKWYLLEKFLLYLLPFLAGAVFLGAVFLKSQSYFNRVYFADLCGAGACGLLFLLAMYIFPPEDLIAVPLLLWFAGSVFWFSAIANRRAVAAMAVLAALSLGAHYAIPPLFNVPKLAVLAYKSVVSAARNFPDHKLVYKNISPFGDLEIYSSSYFHFAPGLSDNAGLNLDESKFPKNAYLGMFIDGEGPNGIIADLPEAQTEYFHYLPMYYPFLLKKSPDTFIVQFAGGLSTTVALRSHSKSVTVAESNPAILQAFRTDPALKAFTGDVLADPRIHVIPYEGRLYLAHTANRYDVIDLSLADSTGLSSPGGAAIVEKYAYTKEAMQSYMRALKEGGILSVTLWNKEEPPKSILKFYATIVAAARQTNAADLAKSFYVTSNYLSHATVLYKRGGFTDDDLAKLHTQTKALSFDEIYYPGFAFDTSQTNPVLDGFREQIFGSGSNDVVQASAAAPAAPQGAAAGAPDAPGAEPPLDGADAAPTQVPATTMGQLAWHYLVHGGWGAVASRYVFDVRMLTNDRPYFAAYVRPVDLPRTLDRLDLFVDESGYLLLWLTLAIASACALVLVMFPVVFGWRTIFSRYPGKFGTIVYFACLGLGYIMVEVGLIAFFILALSNATVSASVLITGMLVFSGLGALLSERFLNHARVIMPIVFLAIGSILIGYGLFLDRVLDLIGTFDYGWRLVFCFGLIFPPAFLMGFPMATAMTTLGRLGKDHMFLWAWGINGCFSVIGAAAVPLVATSFGLAAVLEISGGAYILAIPAFFAILLPLGVAHRKGAMA
jgi:hypothetical protein